jgi:hypothetical protein
VTRLVQVLLMQNGRPAGQTLPHAPQLVGSLAVLTQKGTPLTGQSVKGGVHVMPASVTMLLVQVLLMQNGCPVGQALPHAPQLVGSPAVFTQMGTPLNGQEVKGAGHPASMEGHVASGSPTCAVDCESPAVLPWLEHAASAIMLTKALTAIVAAHHRERTRNAIMNFSSLCVANERAVVGTLSAPFG